MINEHLTEYCKQRERLFRDLIRLDGAIEALERLLEESDKPMEEEEDARTE